MRSTRVLFKLAVLHECVLNAEGKKCCFEIFNISELNRLLCISGRQLLGMFASKLRTQFGIGSLRSVRLAIA